MVMRTSSETVVLDSVAMFELHADKTVMHAMSEARLTLSI
jgi:hypothetical protein